jgi:hypothetical protein
MYGNRVRRVPKVAEIVSGIHAYHKNIVHTITSVTLSLSTHPPTPSPTPPPPLSTNPSPASRIFDFLRRPFDAHFRTSLHDIGQ